jgi:hypothetical protein
VRIFVAGVISVTDGNWGEDNGLAINRTGLNGGERLEGKKGSRRGCWPRLLLVVFGTGPEEEPRAGLLNHVVD